MDFEKAYQNFLNGSATDEEIEFVRGEMKKANDINGILESVKNEGATKTAEEQTVKKAIKAFRKKDFLKILIIVSATLLLLALAVSLAVGIPILSHANDNLNYSVSEAKEIAINHLTENLNYNRDEIEIIRVEKELEVEGRIKHARYIYVLDIYNGKNNVLEVEIDSKTGKIIDLDD